MPPRKRRRRRSYKRLIQVGIGVVLVCALPFVVLAALVATVNPNRCSHADPSSPDGFLDTFGDSVYGSCQIGGESCYQKYLFAWCT